MKFTKENTLAIVVDMQERLMPAMYAETETLKNTVKLVKGLRILGVPIIPLRQYPKGLGDIVQPLKAELEGCLINDKVTFSAMGTAEIVERIQKTGKQNILVCGVEAHVCVLQTLIDLEERGYHTALMVDCTDSRNIYDKEIALCRAQQEGVRLTTSESILFELLQTAGAEPFKQISALVKERENTV